MSNYHIMLDLETFGTSHDAAIIQIGACYFDPDTGKIGKSICLNIDLIDSQKHGQFDAVTLSWWFKQNQQAIESVINNIHRYPLAYALKKFNTFIKKGTRIWCHSTFDMPILMNAYKATGISPSFGYRDTRDIRTIVDLSDMIFGKEKCEVTRIGIHHNALDDCKYQAAYVSMNIHKISRAAWPKTGRTIEGKLDAEDV